MQKHKLFIFTFCCLILQSFEQCCTKLVAGSKKCAQCPNGTHLYRGSCIIDVDNCNTYSDGFSCSACKSGFTVSNGECVASGSGAVILPADSNVQEIYPDFNSTDNLLILADYSRSIQKQLETAEVLFGFIRKYNNGTQYTVVQYATKNNKYFESIAQFDKTVAFAFKLVSIKQLLNKPVKKTSQSPANNNGNSGNSNPTPPAQNNNTVPPVITPPSQPSSSGPTNSLAIAKVSFTPLNFEQRNKNKGFKAIDGIARTVLVQNLGVNPIVIAAYIQTKGLNSQYLIYYESTDKKSVYENRSVYQSLRDKAYIISFTKTNLR